MAAPTSGIEITLVLTNLAAPGGGGVTVITKFVLTLFVPSLTVNVFVAVPVWPNAGTNVKYQCCPSASCRNQWKTAFVVGNSAGLEEAKLNCRLLGTSPGR